MEFLLVIPLIVLDFVALVLGIATFILTRFKAIGLFTAIFSLIFSVVLAMDIFYRPQ